MTSVLKVDNIQNSSGTSALSIDSSGRVTRNVLPSFRIGLDANQAITTSGSDITILWDDDDTTKNFIQGGMSLSSGIVTVPVAGVYQIHANVRFDNVGSGYVTVNVKINNSTAGNEEIAAIDGDPPTSYQSIHLSDVYKLDANDNIRVTILSQSDTDWRVNSNSSFSGAMIG